VSEPGLSIVVAAWPDAAGLVDCLEALDPQRDASTDVIVVCPEPAPELQTRFPWASWVRAPQDGLVPHLWGLGIAAAARELVALTTAHFTPAPDWLPVIRAAHERLASPALGGAIDPPRGARLVDWATYFLRYSAYLGYRCEQAVPDLAADNAAYERRAILAHPELLAEGFWEQELHGRLRREGHRLVFVPAMRVRLCASFGFWPFLRQRLLHGRRFGRARLEQHRLAWRIAAMLAAPLVPAVLVGKVLLRVVRSGRDLGPFLGSLPILFAFALAWGAGEAWGYWAPGPGASATPAG
jgi:hypothetical protein